MALMAAVSDAAGRNTQVRARGRESPHSVPARGGKSSRRVPRCVAIGHYVLGLANTAKTPIAARD